MSEQPEQYGTKTELKEIRTIGQCTCELKKNAKGQRQWELKAYAVTLADAVDMTIHEDKKLELLYGEANHDRN